METPTERPTTTVSLVLGSGGARGLAHIGVIRWLVDNGYDIRSIAGASMGALVGGIHAARKLEVYADWVSALERKHVLRLLDPTFGRTGIFKGERIMGVLRELIGTCNIEALPLAYTAVATDMETGDEVWLRHGDLFDAIRASIATPMVFTPFHLGGRTLLDGALVNPLPVTPTLDDETDLIIAVNLSGPAEQRPDPPPAAPPAAGGVHRQRLRALVANLPLPRGRASPAVTAAAAAAAAEAQGLRGRGMLDVAFVAMQAMQTTITRLKLAAGAPDVTIEIPRNACAYHEFWRAEEMIALGRERAAQALAGPASAP
jgi:NTE family protein